MPNTRDKLIDLMTAFYGVDPMYYGVEAHHLADHLIANGVTVQQEESIYAKYANAMRDETMRLVERDLENINRIPKVATVQKWIPVTERLPESKTKILVYGGNNLIWVNGVNKPMPSVYTGYMRGLDEGWFTWDEQKYIAKVTHWMPLPEPPKGE